MGMQLSSVSVSKSLSEELMLILVSVRVNKETNQMEEETKEGYDISIEDLAEGLSIFCFG